MLRAKKRVLRCAQPASRRLLRKTAILTQMLRPRNSASAIKSKWPGTYQWYQLKYTRHQVLGIIYLVQYRLSFSTSYECDT